MNAHIYFAQNTEKKNKIKSMPKFNPKFISFTNYRIKMDYFEEAACY